MRVDVVTIFPDYLAPLDLSIVGRARRSGAVDVHVSDLREHTTDRHRTVDDTPAGGGAGMVMRPEPWGASLDAVVASGRDAGAEGLPRLLVPSPAGLPLTQAMAGELAAEDWLVFACGRYEGIDERVLDEAGESGLFSAVTPVSLGDYVLCGGEVAVLAIVEAVVRLLPGVLGNPASIVEESHSAGLLEHPAYTRPATWRGRQVPATLMSGDHARIARWRRDRALERTAQRRPDLLAALPPGALDDADLAALSVAGWSPDRVREGAGEQDL